MKYKFEKPVSLRNLLDKHTCKQREKIQTQYKINTYGPARKYQYLSHAFPHKAARIVMHRIKNRRHCLFFNSSDCRKSLERCVRCLDLINVSRLSHDDLSNRCPSSAKALRLAMTIFKWPYTRSISHALNSLFTHVLLSGCVF